MKNNHIIMGAHNHSSEELKELSMLIEYSLSELYKEYKQLIEYKVHERSIVFRFAIHFHKALKTSSFNNYHLDIEYNRNGYYPKITKHFYNGAYPDLILHQREKNSKNFLILEFKPWWNKDQTRDKKKICDFMNPDGEFKYRYGAVILIGKGQATVEWINNCNCASTITPSDL